MACLRFTDQPSRPLEFLDSTSVTLAEFQHLVPPFEAAFQAPMAAWHLDGKPRTARQFAVYKNCPLPTPETWWVSSSTREEQIHRSATPSSREQRGVVPCERGKGPRRAPQSCMHAGCDSGRLAPPVHRELFEQPVRLPRRHPYSPSPSGRG
jgi:hypothetical protein